VELDMGMMHAISLSRYFALLFIGILPLVPESPQWLVYQGCRQEALKWLALSLPDGDSLAPAALLRLRETEDTLEWEKGVWKTNLAEGIRENKV
jgi:hypothetical protein